MDLRWGVTEEAALDQQTMPICLEEIERCRRLTQKPNFVVVLGDRYGWRPAPQSIPGYEWNVITNRCSPEQGDLLKQWYRADCNAVFRVDDREWPAYVLKPRDGEWTNDVRWRGEERRLTTILEDATPSLPRDLVHVLAGAEPQMRMELHDRLKYHTSVIEQEIYRGALRVEGIQDHVHCFFRLIANRDEVFADPALRAHAKQYFDVDGNGVLDQASFNRQQALTELLRGLLPRANIHDYRVELTSRGLDGCSTWHILTVSARSNALKYWLEASGRNGGSGCIGQRRWSC